MTIQPTCRPKSSREGYPVRSARSWYLSSANKVSRPVGCDCTAYLPVRRIIESTPGARPALPRFICCGPFMLRTLRSTRSGPCASHYHACRQRNIGSMHARSTCRAVRVSDPLIHCRVDGAVSAADQLRLQVHLVSKRHQTGRSRSAPAHA
jgi:hypothetical protein